MVLLISYDLNKHERPSAYAAVSKAVEDSATSFYRPLFSQWLVETRSGATWWREHLCKVIDDDDRLFICQVTPERDGWMGKEIWEWLNARISD
jgi:hypothetical protein